jgi:hypothetical protein
MEYKAEPTGAHCRIAARTNQIVQRFESSQLANCVVSTAYIDVNFKLNDKHCRLTCSAGEIMTSKFLVFKTCSGFQIQTFSLFADLGSSTDTRGTRYLRLETSEKARS